MRHLVFVEETHEVDPSNVLKKEKWPQISLQMYGCQNTECEHTLKHTFSQYS